jgi:transposase
MLKKYITHATKRELRRIEVVEAIVVRGEEVTTVSRVYNTPLRTVFDWLARYRGGGWDALKEGQRSGRRRKVTGDLMKWLYNKITMGDPRQFQFPFCLWTLDIIRKILKKEHGIELSKSAVSRLLKHMGLSPQRPIYRSYRQDPEEIKKYLETRYPEVARRAKQKGWEIFFIDEAAVRSDCHHGTTWGAVGETPEVQDSGDRFTIKMISAVSAKGLMRFSFIEGRMNSDRFIEFIRKLRKDVGKPIVVVADNASYHTSKKTIAFGKEEGIEILPLPTYSPQLNPDEQVWNHAKRRLSKLFVVTKDEVKNALLSIMRSIQKTPKLIKSFFQLKDTLYAK